MPDFAVIIPAAGQSSRFGSPVNKLYQLLGGEPVLLRTLRAFAGRDDVTQIVIASQDKAAIERCAAGLPDRQRGKITVCKGGECRAASVRAGIEASSMQWEWIAVHDAARPLVSSELIDRTLHAAVEVGAAGAALPVNLTIKQAAGRLPAKVQRTVPRNGLWAMQTPQIARRKDFLDCFAHCPIPLEQVTDDMQVLELCGLPVCLVQGDERNLKITTQLDLQIAELMLKS